MKKFTAVGLALAALTLVPGTAAVRAAEEAGDYVLTFARIFVSPSKGVEADDRAPAVRETMVFHDAANEAGRETGKSVLEYRWTRPPGRLSSSALDKLEIKSVIAVREASGEWTTRPKTVWPNLFFLKAGDTDLLEAAMAGKWADVSAYRVFKLTRMSLMPDKYHSIDEMVSNQNQAQHLPFARVWKGQALRFAPADHPRAVLIIKVDGLLAKGYACYVYEYDPQGTKKPIP